MSRTLLIVLILFFAVLLAAGNIFGHALVVQELTGSPPTDLDLTSRLIHTLGNAITDRPQWIWFFSGAPLLLGIVLALLVGLTGSPRQSVAAGPSSAAGDDPAAEGALRMLGLLQQEGRLIDFLEEDIAPYDDAQVGAAVRAIHADCRKALHERVRIERIFAEEDGSQVEVPTDLDKASVRLTGHVHGQPPFRGTLQHGGWRAHALTLPRGAGVDPAILAPAEVEVGA